MLGEALFRIVGADAGILGDSNPFKILICIEYRVDCGRANP
jgi:hypothetical protein